MSQSDDSPVVFVCTDCGEQILVDEDMRDTLIENGCVICNEPASISDFESLR